MTSSRILFDEAIEVDPDEGLAGVGTPVAEQAMLDVLGLERFAQERVVAEEDHAAGKVIASEPVGVHFVEFIDGERRRNLGCGCHRSLQLQQIRKYKRLGRTSIVAQDEAFVV